MSKKQGVPASLSGAARKQRYEEHKQFDIRADGSCVRTHKRVEFHVSVVDLARIKRIGIERKALIPTLLGIYDLYGDRSSKQPLADFGHRAWRRLGADILDLVGSDRPMDMAFLHRLRQSVESALWEMKEDEPSVMDPL